MAAAGVAATGGTLPRAHEWNHPVDAPTSGGRRAADAWALPRGAQATPRLGGGGDAIHRRKSTADARMRTWWEGVFSCHGPFAAAAREWSSVAVASASASAATVSSAGARAAANRSASSTAIATRPS